MKLRLLASFVAITAAALLMPTLAAAERPHEHGKPQQYTYASGGNLDSDYWWYAQSDLGGAHARGYFWADNRQRGQTVAGHVTCLSVSGKEATFGFKIERSSNPGIMGQYAYIFAGDRDDPTETGQDAVGSSSPTVVPAKACVSPAPANFFSPNLKGDIEVDQTTAEPEN